MIAQDKTFRLALCSMPWAIFDRPSIQLASLKSYLEKSSSYEVDSHHPYLHIAALLGVELYPKIALSGWGGEALFSSLFYPENQQKAEQLFYKSLPAKIRKTANFTQLTKKVKKICEDWLEQTDLSSYQLMGFSVCFNQLLPSLYMARLIKAQYPSIKIVFGGSSCSAALGESLVEQFDELDYVISGEGEKRLLLLCDKLCNNSPDEIDGVYHRQKIDSPQTAVSQLSLEDLPLPDFRPYFEELKVTFPTTPFIPQLPIEFSRGCWWSKCTFCNLNLQWCSYRYKSGNKMVQELLQLCSTYESLHFTFTDNALPPKEADFFFEKIGAMNLDVDFFAEIRGTGDPKRLQTYRRGGLRTVQVGIEALSTSLLQKMRKGNSVMDNVAMMKLCAEQNIKLEGNLITEFPSSTEEEVEETLINLEYVLPFAPLETAAFFLGYGSPIHETPADYSIDTILPHRKMQQLFPKKECGAQDHIILGYRGDRVQQKTRWRPVAKMIADWAHFYGERSQKTTPPLSYRDGGNFLIIRQEKLTGNTLHHRLRGLSRKIYLTAQLPTDIETIRAKFPKVSPQALDTFLREMCSKRLMFQEKNRIISLAIRQR